MPAASQASQLSPRSRDFQFGMFRWNSDATTRGRCGQVRPVGEIIIPNSDLLTQPLLKMSGFGAIREPGPPPGRRQSGVRRNSRAPSQGHDREDCDPDQVEEVPEQGEADEARAGRLRQTRSYDVDQQEREPDRAGAMQPGLGGSGRYLSPQRDQPALAPIDLG